MKFTCRNCGIGFESHHPQSAYCPKPECKNARNRHAKKLYRYKNRVRGKCRHCKEQLPLEISKYRRYCDKEECQNAKITSAHHRQFYKKRAEIEYGNTPCPRCGKRMEKYNRFNCNECREKLSQIYPYECNEPARLLL